MKKKSMTDQLSGVSVKPTEPSIPTPALTYADREFDQTSPAKEESETSESERIRE